MHKKLMEKVNVLAALKVGSEKVLGSRTAKFLCDLMTSGFWLDEARPLWRAHIIKAGYPPAAADFGEDNFLMHWTKANLMAIRHIMDDEMVTNEKRREGFVYMMMALLADDYNSAAQKIKEGGQEATEMFEACLIVKAPSANVN